jgi:hypothetical protein
MSYAPRFVYSIITASLLQRYLSSNLALEVVVHKYSDYLSELYNYMDTDMLHETVEMCLYTMSDASVGDDSELYLIDYQYNNFTLTEKNKPRNWRPLFGNPLQGIKKLDYSSTTINKHFNAFIYNTKRQGKFIAEKEWSLDTQKESKFLSDMNSMEISPFDILIL